jgi:hypothetical protein
MHIEHSIDILLCENWIKQQFSSLQHIQSSQHQQQHTKMTGYKQKVPKSMSW